MSTEADTCRKFVVPKLQAAGWDNDPHSIAEQTRIVAEVERRLSVVEELEAVVSTNLQRATRLRQSILQKAFTGELVGGPNSPQPKGQRP
jgi:type I restriction enzyme S subunit